MRIARNQTAVYWAPSGTHDSYGNPVFSDPAEVNVRWEDRNEFYVGKDGKEYRSTSVVYPASELQNEGMLYLGELTDLTEQQQASPKLVTDAKEIRAALVSPNLRATTFVYKVWL